LFDEILLTAGWVHWIAKNRDRKEIFALRFAQCDILFSWFFLWRDQHEQRFSQCLVPWNLGFQMLRIIQLYYSNSSSSEVSISSSSEGESIISPVLRRIGAASQSLVPRIVGGFDALNRPLQFDVSEIPED
jgi:hypothetical protein